MSKTLTNVCIHIVFSTKHRKPLIDDQISGELYRYMGGICKALGCIPVKIGGHYDHVHILCKLSATITLADLLEDVKKRSSKWIKTKDRKYARFYWQKSYAAFSADPSKLAPLISYIEHQKEHHTKRSFQDECRLFFKKYGVEYDERYIWD